MELTYDNYGVRIINNPSDTIIRFTDLIKQRIYETTFTERSFIDYQVFGGLDFVTNLLISAFQSESESPTIEDFKTSPKQITFKLTYTPDTHLKMAALEFTFPAVRKEQANADLEALSQKVDALLKLNKNLEKETKQLRAELDAQKSKTPDYIFIPGICFTIDVNIQQINIGMHGTTVTELLSPTGGNTFFNYYTVLSPKWNSNPHHYFSVCNIPTGEDKMFGFIEAARGGEWTGNIDNLRYLKKCKTLRIINGVNITDYSPISEMTELEVLSIIRNDDTKAPESGTNFDISWIKSLKKLKCLRIQGYKKFNDIRPLAHCPELTSLDVRGSGVNNTACLPGNVSITK